MKDKFLNYIFGESQEQDAREGDIEALLEELKAMGIGAAEVKARKPAEKAVRALGVEGGEFAVGEGDVFTLTFEDSEEFLRAAAILGDVNKVNELADAGWVAVPEGDVAGMTEPGDFRINFVHVGVAQPAERTPKTGERPEKAADQMNEPGTEDLTGAKGRRRGLPKGVGKDAAQFESLGGLLLHAQEAAKGPVKIVHCGSCEGYHRIDFRGDCREDSERFASPEEAEERLGCEVVEVDEESPEAQAGFPPIGVGFWKGAGIPRREEARELSVADQHRLRIARQTLKMNDAMANVMGGMTKDEARKVVKELAGREACDDDSKCEEPVGEAVQPGTLTVERALQLLSAGQSTCPTSDGHDLDVWDEALEIFQGERARRRGGYQGIAGRRQHAMAWRESVEEARIGSGRVAAAFAAGRPASEANTSTDGQAFFLHGNKIAEIRDGHLWVSMAGWNSATTRERLNAVLDAFGLPARVHSQGGVRGQPFSGKSYIRRTDTEEEPKELPLGMRGGGGQSRPEHWFDVGHVIQRDPAAPNPGAAEEADLGQFRAEASALVDELLGEDEAEPRDVQPATASAHLYKFDELSPKAKERAKRNAEEAFGYSWADESIESLKALAKAFGGELKDYEIDWGGGTRSSAEFDMPDMEPTQIEATLRGLGTYDEKTLKGHGACKLTGVFCDESAIDGFRQAWHAGERDLNALMQAAFETWLKDAQSDYEHEYSDEGFGETADANDWLFLESGEMP
jgi:hypothetical protein